MALWTTLTRIIRGQRQLKKTRGKARHLSSARPNLEGLETRCLLSYTITDLGALGGTTSQASAVNASGAVAGMSTLSSGDQRAMSYLKGSLSNLGHARRHLQQRPGN
jgi:probable HAF family extracellular repeat protein